jgi:glycosyltransferase involved in cell wall biosynthesis
LKLLIVSRGVRPLSANLTGGAEYVLLNHALGLARLGHEVHVVSDYEGDPPQELPFVLHRVGVPSWLGGRLRKAGFYLWILLHLLGNTLAFLSALRALRGAKGSPFDVVHSHANLAGLLLSLFHKSTPIAYTEHDSTPWSCVYPSRAERIFRRAIYGLFNVPLFKRADTVLTLYSEQRDELQARWGIPSDRITVMSNGVNEHSFSPNSANGAKADGGFCLFVGRLEPRKGVDILLRALRDCSISCQIVGDGPERQKLQALASELGLDSRVSFLGTVSNDKLRRYYCQASFMVMPSLSEAFPLTALEAMACGKPVVASRVGALTSLLESNRCGLLCEPGNASEFAATMQSLSDDPKLAHELGYSGRQAVLQSFTWDIIALRLVEIYRSLRGIPLEATAHAHAD